jgi:hypothetical protein
MMRLSKWSPEHQAIDQRRFVAAVSSVKFEDVQRGMAADPAASCRAEFAVRGSFFIRRTTYSFEGCGEAWALETP